VDPTQRVPTLAPLSLLLRGVLVWGLIQPVVARPLEEIRAQGVLKVGLYLSGAPLAFRDSSGALQGLEVALARKLAADLPGQVDFQVLPAQDRLRAVEEERVDLVIGNLTVTAQRAQVVNFSEPYYRPYQALAVLPGDPARTLADLKTARIAVLADSSSVLGVQRWLPEATVVPVASYAAALEQIQGGRIRALSADNTVLLAWRDKLRLLPVPLQGYVLALALPKGIAHQDLRTWVNAELAQWQQDQSLAQLLTQWGLNSSVPAR